jgi:3-isopropylmalate/(R)-2-methylmalate dehydratase large subunit
MGMTLAEKILARKAGLAAAAPGQIVRVEPDVAMAAAATTLIAIRQFRELGVARVWDPSRIVIVLDHEAPAYSIETAGAAKAIREFAREQGIAAFYDVGEGICHQLMVERGHALPGALIVGKDSHSTSYGAVGAMGVPIGATETACLWGTGRVWLRVPESVRVVVRGRPRPGVYAKDMILRIVGEFGQDGCTYKAIEFAGPAVEAMDVPDRFTLANMAVEMGAKAGMVAFDETTRRYLDGRARGPYAPLAADPDAAYERTLEVDGTALEPMICCPPRLDDVRPVSAVAGVRVDQAFLGSCTNGRIEDLALAAAILKGRRLAPGVRMVIGPASREVLREAVARGYAETFLAAGAVILPPGCGPCFGGHQGILAEGEVCISGANRNYPGRMGHKQAEIYVGSPAVVAASAVAGHIADPREYLPFT